MNTAPQVPGRFILLAVIFLLATLPGSWAQPSPPPSAISHEGQHVSSVEIAGRPDLDQDALRLLISQPVDAPYSQEKVDETVAALKSAGQFEGVELNLTTETAGLRLMFVIQPALYFGVFNFSRASRIFSYTRLLQVADYPKQEPYTTARVTKAQSNLLDFIHQNGYFLGTVEPQDRIRPAARRSERFFPGRSGAAGKSRAVDSYRHYS